MYKNIFTLCLAVVLAACVSQPDLNAQAVTETAIKNIQQAGEQVFAGGQPSQAQLEQLKQAGISAVVSLRPSSELSWDERKVVESLGMTFHHIPVNGLADINLEKAKALHQLLQSNPQTPMFLHCASGNRVGALVAVIEHEIKQQPVEKAIAEGRRWGLTRLALPVRQKLERGD